ncbi:MAG: S8 family serine peptidase [Coriobacteriia bacterium]
MDRTMGWHVGRRDGASEWEGGPYSWAELVAFASEGRLQATDYVWHESMAEWTLAGAISGLTVVPAAPQPTFSAPQSTLPPTPKNRVWLIATAIAVAVLILGGVGVGSLLFLRGGPGNGGPDLGVATAKVPDRASLIQTAAWGEVPANQVCLLMAKDAKRSDAEKAAKTLGGTIVGEVEYADVYQIEFPGKNEADLAAALTKAQTADKVDGAFPNQQVYLDAEIWGVRVDPYNDPIYDNGAGDGYKAIGVSKAWTYVKGAGLELGPVRVGVVDDGLYLPGKGAENEFEGGKVKIEFPDPAAGILASPEVYPDGTINPAGNHGTGVSTLLAANPDNGGPSGVAGPLGDKLTVSVLNAYSGQYGQNAQAAPDPNDPTKTVGKGGKTYAVGDLVALTKQIESGATVINCSWGNSNASTGTVAAYTRFFTKMSTKHPNVLFVCSGGNDGKVMDGSKRFPSGLKLPNMITVGALNNDGTTATYADKASPNYEITLGAPGTQAVVGLKSDGGAERQDGSRFAAPQVTGAAAILRSLNPKLSAGQIKQILSETARGGVTDASDPKNPHSHPIAQDMGGRILAVDLAVLKVINDLRAAKGLPPLTAETLEKMGVVDGVAVTGEPGEYAVRGIVGAAGEKGTKVKIQVFGESSAFGGNTEQFLAGAGESKWNVTLPKAQGTIRVTRQDNGAASVITIQPSTLAGTWAYPEYFLNQKTGGMLTFSIVETSSGYALTDKWAAGKSTVTLVGKNVTIAVPAIDGGKVVMTGVLEGDKITGKETREEDSNSQWTNTDPWNATRVK